MAASFDPYHKWLGIAPQEQPPNHYRLLGIPLFEPNADVIEAAADRQMAHLRTYQTGKQGAISQRLLNEVSAARVCLLNATKKAAYDQALREKLATEAADDQKDAVAPELIGLGQETLRSSASRLSKISGSSSQPQPATRLPKLYLAAGAGGVLVVALAAWLLWPSQRPPAPPAGTTAQLAASGHQDSPQPQPQSPQEADQPKPASQSPSVATAGTSTASAPAPSTDNLQAKSEAKATPPASPPSFPNAPPPAIAPFDADQAKKHQEAWAKYLGVPVELTNSIGMKFVLVPPGEFQMGERPDLLAQVIDEAKSRGSKQEHLDYLASEQPQHRVRISKPFFLGRCEVTQSEYQQVMGNNPAGYSPAGGGADKVSGEDTASFPVEGVSWERAQTFCGDLSATSSEKAAQCSYRLPTEAEWEYACRAGTSTPYYFGEDRAAYGDHGWVGHNSGGRTHRVAQKTANPWRLYDLYGGVWELCADWYSPDYYARSPGADPRGPESGERYVRRGGCWWQEARSAMRNSFGPRDRNTNCGFRVVCDVLFRPAEPRTDLAGAIAATPANDVPAKPGDAVSPKPAVEAAASPGKPAAVPGGEPASAAPTARLVPAADVAKLPVPDEAAQQKARRIVEETYRGELPKAKSGEENAALAKRMLEQAGKTSDDAAGCFVLLDAARKKAVEVLDVDTAMEAAARMGATYQVDAPQMKLDALAAIGKKARSPAGHKLVAEQALATVDEALSSDAFDVARQLGKLAQSEAGRARDKELTLQVRARLKDLEDAHKAFERVEQARALLKTRPDDAESNSIVGRYVCFNLGKWDEGLPMLARGSEPTLKGLAETELKPPASSEQWLALADQWYELSLKAPASMKKRIEQRARHWYFEALPELRGMARAKVETRLDKLGPDAGLPKQIANKIDGSVLVLIPAGKFLAGGPKPEEGGGPPFPVSLPPYYIGLCEVTNAQYKRFIDATGQKPPDLSWAIQPVWKDRDFLLEMADHPVMGVSWHAARDYCRWAGMRLPAELEWEKAARGGDGREYPWGNVFEEQCYHAMPTTDRRITTAPVTSCPAGRSPYGLYHMVGNVSEWCADAWEANAYARYRSGDFTPPVSNRNERVRRSFGVGYGLGSRESARIMRRMPQWDGNTRYDAPGFRVAKDAVK